MTEIKDGQENLATQQPAIRKKTSRALRYPVKLRLHFMPQEAPSRNISWLNVVLIWAIFDLLLLIYFIINYFF